MPETPDKCPHCGADREESDDGYDHGYQCGTWQDGDDDFLTRCDACYDRQIAALQAKLEVAEQQRDEALVVDVASKTAKELMRVQHRRIKSLHAQLQQAEQARDGLRAACEIGVREIAALQARLCDVQGLPQSINGVGLLVEDALAPALAGEEEKP